MFGIEKDIQNLMEQVYGPLNGNKMTEIEKTKKEIEVLTAKLALLEEMEKHKSPCEEAFKRVYGYYPEGCERSVWIAFQKGYDEAQKDYKVGEYQPTPQEPEEEPEELKTLYQMLDDKKHHPDTCVFICNIVEKWLFDNTEFIEEDYHTVTLKLKKGMIGKPND